jgi:hypothetical protein
MVPESGRWKNGINVTLSAVDHPQAQSIIKAFGQLSEMGDWRDHVCRV